MIYVGLVIVIITFVAIIKKVETRMCLMIAGFIMAILAMNPMAAVTAFVKAMTNSLVETICATMGFAMVMKMTHCDEHMVKILTTALKKVPAILIPGAVLVTWLINIALVSAAGCSAAVGAILIPALIKSGVYPAMAAAAVFGGTFGSVLSPGNPHNVYVSKLMIDAGKANGSVMEIIGILVIPAAVAAVIVAIGVTITSRLRKEATGYVPAGETEEEEAFKPNFIMAITPVIPLIILILATQQVGVLPKQFQSIPLAMLIGCLIGTVVTKTNPGEIVKDFWKGAGNAYGSVMGLIICASVFTAGMTAIGLTGSLIEFMKHSQSIAKFAGGFGSFIIAVLAGSGDAATLAFNGAITPHAEEFGMVMSKLGSVSNISGALGRSCSPVAAACIVCAGIAGVSPMEITKRNFPVMLVVVCVVLVLL